MTEDQAATPGPDPEAVEMAHRLFDAAREGDTALLTRFIAAGAPADLTTASGDTLLMLAAYHGHEGTVEYLLGAGATVDAFNDRGQSPLAGAVFKGYAGVVRLLVAAGADADAGNPSARATAAYFQKPELLALLEATSAE